MWLISGSMEKWFPWNVSVNLYGLQLLRPFINISTFDHYNTVEINTPFVIIIITYSSFSWIWINYRIIIMSYYFELITINAKYSWTDEKNTVSYSNSILASFLGVFVPFLFEMFSVCHIQKLFEYETVLFTSIQLWIVKKHLWTS